MACSLQAGGWVQPLRPQRTHRRCLFVAGSVAAPDRRLRVQVASPQVSDQQGALQWQFSSGALLLPDVTPDDRHSASIHTVSDSTEAHSAANGHHSNTHGPLGHHITLAPPPSHPQHSDASAHTIQLPSQHHHQHVPSSSAAAAAGPHTTQATQQAAPHTVKRQRKWAARGNQGESTSSAHQLAQRIKRCRTLQGLQQLYESTGRQWDSLHVSSALMQAAKASELVGESTFTVPKHHLPFLRTFLTTATQHTQAGRYRPRQLSGLLWVCARLGLSIEPEGEALVLTVATQLTQMLSSAAPHVDSAGSHGSDGGRERPSHVEALAQPSVDMWHMGAGGGRAQVSPSSSTELAQPSHISGTSQLHKAQDSVGAMPGGGRGVDRVGHMATDSGGALTLSSLEISDRGVDKGGHIATETRQSVTLSSLDISMTAWSLARLGGDLLTAHSHTQSPPHPHTANDAPEADADTHAHGREWVAYHGGGDEDRTAATTTVSTGSHDAATKAVFLDLWSALMPHIVALRGRMSAQETSNTLWALARAGVRAPAGCDVAAPAAPPAAAGLHEQAVYAAVMLAHSSVRVVGQMDVQHVANVAWTLAKIGIRYEPLLQRLADHVVRRDLHLGARGTSLLAWSYGSLGYSDPSLCAYLTKRVTHIAGGLTGQGMSNVVWGLIRMLRSQGAAGHDAMQQLSLAMAQHAPHRMSEMQPLGLVTLMTLWADAGYHSIPLFDAVVSRAKQLLPTFHTDTLAKLCHALVKVGHQQPRFMDLAARELQSAFTQQYSQGTHVSGGGPIEDVSVSASVCGGNNNEGFIRVALVLADTYGHPRLADRVASRELLAAMLPTLLAAASAGRLTPANAVRVAGAYAQADMAAAARGRAGAAAARRLAAALYDCARPALLAPRPLATPLIALAWAAVRLRAAGPAGALVGMCLQQPWCVYAPTLPPATPDTNTTPQPYLPLPWALRLTRTLLMYVHMRPLQGPHKTGTKHQTQVLPHQQAAAQTAVQSVRTLLGDTSSMELTALLELCECVNLLIQLGDAQGADAHGSEDTQSADTHGSGKSRALVSGGSDAAGVDVPRLTTGSGVKQGEIGNSVSSDPSQGTINEALVQAILGELTEALSVRLRALAPWNTLHFLSQLPTPLSQHTEPLVETEVARVLTWARAAAVAAPVRYSPRRGRRAVPTALGARVRERVHRATGALQRLGRYDARAQTVLTHTLSAHFAAEKALRRPLTHTPDSDGPEPDQEQAHMQAGPYQGSHDEPLAAHGVCTGDLSLPLLWCDWGDGPTRSSPQLLPKPEQH